MTPQLMEAGSRAREARYSRVVQAGELNVAHGAILYLDDITVSFDGFKALNALFQTLLDLLIPDLGRGGVIGHVVDYKSSNDGVEHRGRIGRKKSTAQAFDPFEQMEVRCLAQLAAE